MLRVELSPSALSFCPTLLGIKCKELLSIPVEEIQSVRLVNERGTPSFEVNTMAQAKFCWFDVTAPDEWEQAFASVGVAVEHEPDPVPEKVAES